MLSRLHDKHFCVVWRQERLMNIEEQDLHPLPSLLLTPFFVQSFILVPSPLLRNHTETLAT